jgi:RNA-directed DNA polymerase
VECRTNRQTEGTSATVLNVTKQAEEADLWKRVRLREVAEPCVWTERMLTALVEGVKGGKWFSLMDKVYSKRTLRHAWEQVRRNKGAAGVDRQTVAFFDKDADKHLDKLHRELRDGNYRPHPVKRTWIDKEGKREKRPLGIPTVRDRIVQTALRFVLEPIFEREFLPSSYGFRRGLGCKDALREVDGLLKDGFRWVVDVDFKSFFDTIDHDRLMELVGQRVSDGRILALLEAYLHAEVLDGMKRWQPEQGTPQGAVISPLLSNIYLHELDTHLLQAGCRMIRYADDFVVLCETEEQANAALSEVHAFADDFGLTVHPTKTRVGNTRRKGDGFDFLGYHFERGKRWASRKKLPALRAKLRPRLKRTNGHSLDDIIASVNPTLRGWFEYFQHSHWNVFDAVDGWVRRRLRSILRKRQKRKGNAKGNDNHRWPNSYFAAHGLFSLKQAYEFKRQSLLCGTH